MSSCYISISTTLLNGIDVELDSDIVHQLHKLNYLHFDENYLTSTLS